MEGVKDNDRADVPKLRDLHNLGLFTSFLINPKLSVLSPNSAY